MAIQLRRGVYADFQPAKMVAGEVAVVTSGDPSTITGKAIYVCYAPGVVQRFVTDEEVAAQVDAAFVDAPHLQQTVINATDEWLDEHPEATTTVQDGAISTEKLADGAVTTAKIADEAITRDKLGIESVESWALAQECVKAYNLDEHVVADYHLDTCNVTETDVRENIAQGETRATIFGKIKKWFTDLAPLLVSATQSYTSGLPYGFTGVTAQRRGNLVRLKISINSTTDTTLTADGWKTVLTLPESFRPSADSVYNESSPQNRPDLSFLLCVRSNGNLQISVLKADTTGYLRGWTNCYYWYFIN